MWLYVLAYLVLIGMIMRAVLAESNYSSIVTARRVDFGSARAFTNLLRAENIPYMFALPELTERLQPSLQHHIFATHYGERELQLFDPARAAHHILTYADMTRFLQSGVQGANTFASYNNRLLLPSVSGLSSDIDSITYGLFAPFQCCTSDVDFLFGTATSQFPRTVHFHSRRFLTSPTNHWRLHLCSWAKYQTLVQRTAEPTLLRCQDEWILNRQCSLHDRLPFTPFTIPKGVFVYIPAGYWYQLELLDAAESPVGMILQLDYATSWNRCVNLTTDWLIEGGWRPPSPPLREESLRAAA